MEPAARRLAKSLGATRPLLFIPAGRLPALKPLRVASWDERPGVETMSTTTNRPDDTKYLVENTEPAPSGMQMGFS